MPCNACGRTDHTNHLDWLNHPELHEKGCQCMGHKKERNMQDRARDRLKLMASKGYYLSGCDSNVTNIIVGYMCEFSDAENAELQKQNQRLKAENQALRHSKPVTFRGVEALRQRMKVLTEWIAHDGDMIQGLLKQRSIVLEHDPPEPCDGGFDAVLSQEPPQPKSEASNG